jgi:hypothetical protein
MKTVKIVSIALVSTFVFFSCKNSESPNLENEASLEKDLAVVESVSSEEIATETFLYVTASTGLSLREYNNLKSKKLAVMPYGTKVKVIAPEENSTMIIDEIKGGMDQIEYNHKKGFAFNGYLSKYFPPEKGISPKGYAEELKLIFPEVLFTETTGGTASKPSNTETLLLPTTKWHEAFYIAQQLFEFPSEFTFPSHKGKEKEIIKTKKSKRTSWISELQVSRQDNKLTKIEYIYKTKGFARSVIIKKEGAMIKLSNIEVVD